jgi:hypothetical protein
MENLGTFGEPESSMNGSAKQKAIRLHEKQLLGNKIYRSIRRRLYQAIVVNIALWEAKAGH